MIDLEKIIAICFLLGFGTNLQAQIFNACHTLKTEKNIKVEVCKVTTLSNDTDQIYQYRPALLKNAKEPIDKSLQIYRDDDYLYVIFHLVMKWGLNDKSIEFLESQFKKDGTNSNIIGAIPIDTDQSFLKIIGTNDLAQLLKTGYKSKESKLCNLPGQEMAFSFSWKDEKAENIIKAWTEDNLKNVVFEFEYEVLDRHKEVTKIKHKLSEHLFNLLNR